MRIGIISDTHGLLRPEAVAAFEHVDQILHAGDIGGDHVLAALRQLAPVTAVAGNVDDGSGHEIVRLAIAELKILLTHILPRPLAPSEEVTTSLAKDRADIVIFGHSHLPHDERVGDVWYFNPASAGPRRFDYPVSVAILERRRREWIAYHVPLDQRSVTSLSDRMNQLR